MELTKKLWGIYKRHRQVASYLVFGGLTTLINIVTYFVAARVFGIGGLISNAIAWVVAVAFAYVTNHIYVFESSARTRREIMREMASFVVFRVASGGIDMGLFALGVLVFGWNDLVVKIGVQVIVIILNYIFSKMFVFRKKA